MTNTAFRIGQRSAPVPGFSRGEGGVKFPARENRS